MKEFYIESNSFAAPFVSDHNHHYVEAETAEDALEKMADTYSHPAGLYAAQAFTSADAKNKGEKPLAEWLCNRVRAEREATGQLGSYVLKGIAPDRFEVNGELHVVRDPKSGYAARVSAVEQTTERGE